MSHPGETDDEEELGVPRAVREATTGLALAGLAAWPVVALLLGFVLMFATDSCFPGDPELICTPRGEKILMGVLIYGCLAAIVSGVAGMIAGPRWRALGLGLGYLINLACTVTAFAIADN
ncbi:MAG TPA: hypothetical protein VN408_27545 [Actinoplanes sp.]|nr:hypothetical protein [Actinoplanes sp.]